MSDTDHIRGIPVAVPPALWAGQPGPSGDALDGMVLALDPATQTINFVRAHIACGPSAISVNRALTGGQDNFLWGPVNYSDYGMRSEMVAYVPPGVWNLYGTMVIAGPTNVEYDIRVWQGMGQSPDPGRVGIASESPIIVGGGVSTWTGAANMPFSIPFSAHLINYSLGAPGTACEVSVSVYPKCSGGAGAALGVITPDAGGGGGLPYALVSSFMISRVRGP